MALTDPLRSRRFAAVALCACLTFSASACGSKDGEPSKAEPGSEPTGAPVDPTPTPSAEPSATTDASPSAPFSPATLTDRLLPTTDVPGLNAQWIWQDGETSAAGTDPFGPCAKVDLASIGASEVVERTYFPPVDTDDSAAEQVAEFPDANTAARALAVLKSWRQKCGPTLNRSGSKIGALTPVPVSSGTAFWYLVSFPDGLDEGRFRAFGVAASGTRIALLSIDNGGQDYNYPAGREPMVAMVKAAATRLG